MCNYPSIHLYLCHLQVWALYPPFLPWLTPSSPLVSLHHPSIHPSIHPGGLRKVGHTLPPLLNKVENMHGCLLNPKLISRKIPVVRIIITGHSLWQRLPLACTVDYKMAGGCHKEGKQFEDDLAMNVFFLVLLYFFFRDGKCISSFVLTRRLPSSLPCIPKGLSSLGIPPPNN